ncbi:MAG: translation elongation factor Ts [Parcubacteria group bacterium]|nr:translation elongation factor Ts [Parcubacteria group bacterium]
MDINAQLVAELRQLTGAGIMDCRKALTETGGEIVKAQEYLRRQGIQKADKKNERVAGEGLIVSYIHAGGKIGVLLDIRCETDFVARNPEFQTLAKEIAMQIAASNPLYISSKDIPQEVLEKEKSIYRDQLLKEGKKEEMLGKIIEGKLAKFYQDVCLLDQQSIRDEKIVIGDIIKEKITKMGEKIEVKRFTRYQI